MANPVLRLILLLLLAWPVMVLTHECGHLMGGWISGATLKDYDLRPWRLPYSLHHPDPHPLVTLWAGPAFGVIAPMSAALLLRKPWAWFLADFCTLANGAYLALGAVSGDRFLDTAMLLEKGAHPASIAAFCLLTIGVGYFRFRRDCMAIFSTLRPKMESPPANG